MKLEAAITLKVLPRPHFSRVVREGITGFAQAHGVDEDDLAHVMTAVGEALANAIEHSGTELPIEVEIKFDMQQFIVTVRDFGVGFEPSERPQATLPGGDCERGRGLPIMQHCCDTFSVTSQPGAGTTVVLGRSLRSRTSTHVA